MEPSYHAILSNTQGTFHFGNDQAWQHKQIQSGDITGDAFGPSAQEIIVLLESCPRMISVPKDQHALKEGINCGMLFRPP